MVDKTSNKRLAKNSILLYVRTMVMMIISLYTSRIILNALGTVNFGVYNAVAGFISMFAVISSSMSAAISRYITYELGKNNVQRLREIFSSSQIILGFISLLIIIIIETGGVWFLNNKMDIPSESLKAANWVLQFSALTFVLGILSVPYNAAIIAHERMSAFAYISILDAFGKLIIAFIITKCQISKLATYAGLLCIWALFIRFIYASFCHRNFTYCRLELRFNKSLIKEIFSFSGWNFLGASSGILRDQGVNVLINVFCGPTINAGRGIAMQVNHAVSSFSNSFTTALNPQITKLYAKNDKEACENLVMRGTKFSCYLLLLLFVPIYFETDFILKVWLKIIPPYSAIFVRLMLIGVLIDTMSNALITLMLATGNIRNYQILVGGLQLLNFPLSWIILQHGVLPQYTIVISIIISILCLITRLLMLKSMVDLDVIKFVKDVICRLLLVAIFSVIVPFVIYSFMEDGWTRLIILTIFSFIITGLSILVIGCTSGERNTILTNTKKIVKKLNANK